MPNSKNSNGSLPPGVETVEQVLRDANVKEDNHKVVLVGV